MVNEFPACPDFSPECMEDGLDVHLHVTPDGKVEVVSCTPTACSDSSPYDWCSMLRERGFRAFAIRSEENATEN